MSEQLNTSGKSLTGADVAGGGAGANAAPSPVAGWVAFYEADEQAARDFWNSISDEWNQWEVLSRDEQLNTIQAFARHRIAEQERCERVADEHVITADDDVQAAYARAAIDIAEVIRRGQ